MCFVTALDLKWSNVLFCSCRQTVYWISGVTAVPWNWAAGVWYSSWFHPDLLWQTGSVERYGEEGFPESCTIITCKSCDKYCYFVFRTFSFFLTIQRQNLSLATIHRDHLCGLVVRVPGYRSRSLGSIPGDTRLSEKKWVWNWVHSALWVQMRSYLKEKVMAPV
jgi:hypothetical protein